MRILSIGECMVEISSAKDDNYKLHFAGDTANTCIYLSRFGAKTSYLTSVGNDSISKKLINFLKKENISTNMININNNKSIGLYVIENDSNGEREFFYWRSNSAAKTLFENIDIKKYINTFKKFDAVYFTGITLSIYDNKNLHIFFNFLRNLKKHNIKIFFDLNIRLKNWKNISFAKKIIKKFCFLCDTIFLSKDDLKSLQIDKINIFINKFSDKSDILFRKGNGAIEFFQNKKTYKYKVSLIKKVLDTTGCGDAFNASFIFNFLNNHEISKIIKSSHKLGKNVAMTKGAILSKKEFKIKDYAI